MKIYLSIPTKNSTREEKWEEQSITVYPREKADHVFYAMLYSPHMREVAIDGNKISYEGLVTYYPVEVNTLEEMVSLLEEVKLLDEYQHLKIIIGDQVV
jgi:hypothetical protein